MSKQNNVETIATQYLPDLELDASLKYVEKSRQYTLTISRWSRQSKPPRDVWQVPYESYETTTTVFTTEGGLNWVAMEIIRGFGLNKILEAYKGHKAGLM